MPILINVVEILLGVFDLRHALKAGRSAPLSPYQTPKINSSTSSKDEASVANAREKREQEPIINMPLPLATDSALGY
jgi:hypothetical protein